MDSPESRLSTEPADTSSRSKADISWGDNEKRLIVDGKTAERTESSYSILVEGKGNLTSTETDEQIDIKCTSPRTGQSLLSGTVGDETIKFTITGEVIATEFAGPEPQLRVDGTAIDTSHLPSTNYMLPGELSQEPVPDPFPAGGLLGSRPNDPIDPDKYEIVIGSGELMTTKAFSFDIHGTVLDHTGLLSVSEDGNRVFGNIVPGNSGYIRINGIIAGIDIPDEVAVGIKQADKCGPLA